MKTVTKWRNFNLPAPTQQKHRQKIAVNRLPGWLPVRGKACMLGQIIPLFLRWKSHFGTLALLLKSQWPKPKIFSMLSITLFRAAQ
jgi:hypothetical protein